MKAVQFTATRAISVAILALTFTFDAFAGDPPHDPRGFIGPEARPAKHARHWPPAPLRRSSSAIDSLRYWIQIAIVTTGLDHTDVKEVEDRQFGHQL